MIIFILAERTTGGSLGKEPKTIQAVHRSRDDCHSQTDGFTVKDF